MFTSLVGGIKITEVVDSVEISEWDVGVKNLPIKRHKVKVATQEEAKPEDADPSEAS